MALQVTDTIFFQPLHILCKHDASKLVHYIFFVCRKQNIGTVSLVVVVGGGRVVGKVGVVVREGWIYLSTFMSSFGLSPSDCGEYGSLCDLQYRL